MQLQNSSQVRKKNWKSYLGVTKDKLKLFYKRQIGRVFQKDKIRKSLKRENWRQIVKDTN